MTSRRDSLRLLEITPRSNHVSYTVVADGEHSTLEGPTLDSLRAFEQSAARLRTTFAGPDAERAFLQDFVASACTPALEQALRSTRSGVSPFLFVQSSDDALARLPWEALPTFLDLHDTLAVRVARSDPADTKPGSPARLLLVTSPRHAGKTLPSLAAESGQIARDSARVGLEVTTLVEPSGAAVLEQIEKIRPARLHLTLTSVKRTDRDVRLRVGADDSGASWLSLADIPGASARDLETVVATVPDGLPICAAFCNAGARAAAGWAGWAEDEQMRRFSQFFYQRLFEGCSPAAAFRLYFSTVLRRGVDRLSGTPVLWLHAPDLEPRGLRPPDDDREGYESLPGNDPLHRGHDGRAISMPALGATTAGVHVEVNARPALNPALIRNGRPAVDHLLITSDVARPAVRLSIVCDTGISTSTYVRQISLLPGPQQVMTEDACFPAIDELCARDGGRRQVNFVVTLRDRDTDRVLAETTRAVVCMAGREWLDHAESWAYLPAFVQPFDKGTLEVVSKAREALGLLGGDGDDFLAYLTNKPADVDRQAEAIFKTLQKGYGIRYMPPPGSGVFTPGERTRAGQFVRLPRDILQHRWGTCHDLALFYAGLLEFVGIRPIIVLGRQHTFAGYFRETAAHASYWRARSKRRKPDEPHGNDWLLHDAADIDGLLQKQAITLVETTHVTQESCTFADATSHHVDASGAGGPRFRADGFQVAVDVRAARAMIQPL